MGQPRKRTTNPYVVDGRPLVAKQPHFNGDYLPDSVAEVVRLLGGVEKAIKPGDRVLIKPNFNCSFALPLSTDRAFLAAAIELLQDAGARVTVGELSGRADWPTDKVFNNLKIQPVLDRYSVKFVNFEHDEWVPIQVDGHYWRSYRVPRTILEAEKRVYLANMRCHSSGRFSASLKLSVGWIDLQDRDYLHQEHETTEPKIAELNLVWQPNLVLVDGRRSTVSWAGRGDYVYPNVIMASGDMVAIDSEAVKILKQYPARNRLDIELSEMGQLALAQAHGLGSMDYLLVEGEGKTRTEQQDVVDPAAVWRGR
jgi:uncharacterized protein (DUF362 family)